MRRSPLPPLRPSALAAVLLVAQGAPVRAACTADAAGTACAGPDAVVIGRPLEAGRLSQAGPGTVTLTAVNTYPGGTLATGGTLAVAGAGTLGSADGALLVDGGRIDLGGTSQEAGLVRLSGGGIGGGVLRGSVYDVRAGAIDAALVGPAPLVKSGPGTVTLSGANAYAGGTRVSAGVLALAGAGTLGSPDAAVVVEGGALDLGGTRQSAGPVVLTGGTIRGGVLRGTIVDLQAGSVEAALTGPGPVVKRGAGTVVLAGLNDYAGPTAVTNGILRTGAPGALPAGGALIVTGAGLLDLASRDQTAASLDGDGRVALGGAELTLAGGSDAAFSGRIEGTGSLVKTGSGRLDLSGDSPFTGAIAVRAGELRVSGALPGAAVAVGAGATLRGTGTVGGLDLGAGAVLAPGLDDVGTLRLAGDGTLAAGSVFRVRARADGTADRLAAGGRVALRGGLVDVRAEAGTYAPETRYTILTAGGGVAGRFAGVSANFAFLTPGLVYGADGVDLVLARNDVAFATVGATLNQARSGARIEALGPADAIYRAVGPLSGGQARAAFDALSGEVHATAAGALVEAAGLARAAILDRMRWSDGAGPACAAPTNGGARPTEPGCGDAGISTGIGRVGLWGQGFGSFGRTRDLGGIAATTRSTGGFAMGGDVAAGAGVRLGVAGGYTSTPLDIPLRGSTATVQSGFGAAYAGLGLGDLDLRLGGSFGLTGTDTRRAIALPGLTETARAAYGGTLAQGFGEVGLPLDVAGLTVEPFAGGAYTRAAQDGFTESGGPAALRSGARETEVATATLGIRLEARLDPWTGGRPLLLRGLAGYRAAFGDVTPLGLLAFASGGGATPVQGAQLAPHAAVLQAGLAWAILPGTTLGLTYQGQVGARVVDHGARGNLSVRF